MLPLLRSELFRLNRRWMPRVLLLGVLTGVAGVYAIFWLILVSVEGEEEVELRGDVVMAEALGTGLDITEFFAAIVTIIMGASIVGTEYGWGTIRSLLPRARSRVGLLAAKLATLALFDLVLVVGGGLIALAMSGLISSAEGFGTELGDNFLSEAAAAIGRTVYVLLPYTTLAFFVAVLTRSNAAGIAIGLVVLLTESIVLGIVTAITDLFDWLDNLLFTRNAEAITAYNGGGSVADDLADPWQAALVLGLWVVAFVAISVVIFQRRDVTSGA